MGGFRDPADLIAEIQKLREQVASQAATTRPVHARCARDLDPFTTAVERAVTFAGSVAQYNIAVSGTRVTVGITGIYYLSSNVGFASNATGRRAIRVQLTSGATVCDVARDTRTAVSGDVTRLSASNWVPLTAGDYLELYCFQNSGGDLSMDDDVAFGDDRSYRALNVLLIRP